MQDPMTGELTMDWHKPTNWSAWGGLWVPCAGSITPDAMKSSNALSNGHAGGEEYEPDAYCWYNNTNWDDFAACAPGSARTGARMLRYWGLDPSMEYSKLQEYFM
jgi:hypothetical protein